MNTSVSNELLKVHEDPCLGCFVGIWTPCLRIALEEKIPAVIHGDSPDQLLNDQYVILSKNGLTEENIPIWDLYKNYHRIEEPGFYFEN